MADCRLVSLKDCAGILFSSCIHCFLLPSLLICHELLFPFAHHQTYVPACCGIPPCCGSRADYGSPPLSSLLINLHGLSSPLLTPLSLFHSADFPFDSLTVGFNSAKHFGMQLAWRSLCKIKVHCPGFLPQIFAVICIELAKLAFAGRRTLSGARPSLWMSSPKALENITNLPLPSPFT